MEKTVKKIMGAQKQMAISRDLANGKTGKGTLDRIMSAKNIQQQGSTMYPGQQFGYSESEVKMMLQNGVKSKGYQITANASASFVQSIDLTGLANIHLGFGFVFSAQNGNPANYPTGITYKINNLSLIEDVHGSFYDCFNLREPYFEYVYLLGGKDTIQLSGVGSGAPQVFQMIIYYI